MQIYPFRRECLRKLACTPHVCHTCIVNMGRSGCGVHYSVCVRVCVCVCLCVCVSERGGGVQPFHMSGAVSGHQSARQRQAEQIISRDVAGKGKERLREERRRRAREGKGSAGRGAGWRGRERPPRRVSRNAADGNRADRPLRSSVTLAHHDDHLALPRSSH